ncbi:MAG: DUF72 domain-containing protein [Acidimicrobiales bacterium]
MGQTETPKTLRVGCAPRTLRVGCAMWANRAWVGRYFPADTPVGRELVPYSSWCTAVEGNTTFYGLPSDASVARWAADAPEEFRFMFKLPELITHKYRLRSCEAELAEFLNRLEPLGDRCAPFSIQLPASFEPDDLTALARFLDELTGDHVWGVEVRHPRFCDGGDDERRLNDLLAHHQAERIIIDTRAVFAGPRETAEEREAFERKPRLTVRPVAIGDYPVVRFIGQTDGQANPQWWAKWVPKVAQWLEEGRSPTVFLHTPDNHVAPELARQFHGEVAALVDDLAPLPSPVQAASQQTLI